MNTKKKERGSRKQTTKSNINVMPEMEDILSCKLCDFDSEIKSELERHMKVLHGMSLPIDDKTEKVIFDEQRTEEVQVESEQDTEEIEVIEIDKEEIETATDSEHATVQEGECNLPDRMFICIKCAMGFVELNGCIEHMSSHFEAIGFKCLKCEKSFLTEPEYERHVQTQHDVVDPMGAKLVNCSKCDFKTMDLNELNMHYQFNHMSVKVNVIPEEQTVLICSHVITNAN
jgi:hypothetical protein